MTERQNWELEPNPAGRARGADPDETTGYEGRGYGSDFDFEGAGGFEDRGGSARGGGPDLEGRWAKRYVEDVAYAARGARDVRNRLEAV